MFFKEREFAKDNKKLGTFDLTGINPAPRGTPQIEVAFDIDANGIVKVSATDKATSKKQEVKITSSSGLSESEIKSMIKDAEENKSKDQEQLKLINKRNELDSLINRIEKMVKESEDKMHHDDVLKVGQVISKARDSLKSNSYEEITQTYDNLEQTIKDIASKISTMNEKPQTNDNSKDNSSNEKKDDDAIDAEYKNV